MNTQTKFFSNIGKQLKGSPTTSSGTTINASESSKIQGRINMSHSFKQKI